MKQGATNLYGPVALVYTANNTGSWRLERPVVDDEKCVACGTCQKFCPADIIDIDKEQSRKVTMNWEYCKGCGICANECPKKCIEMKPEGEAA